MSEGYPSMTALLGLLAIAGYQNRDKLAEWLGGHGATANAGPAAPGTSPSSGSNPSFGSSASVPSSGMAGGLGGLGGLLGGLAGRNTDVGSFLGSGVNDLVDRFRQGGQGEVADSWVNHGPNQPIGPNQMEQAIGTDTLARLAQQTGLSREELLARLSRELPQAIDHYTPDGRLPPRSS